MPGADQVAGAGAPIGAAEADQLLAPLKAHDHLALAVSGGSDSISLMVLVAAWAKADQDAPKVSVLTVDHRLRPEAAGEAAEVGRWAAALGLGHVTLTWSDAKPATGLQAAARAARYRLMSEWCLANGAVAIVTAHTANDQAETLLMRLARGSGVDGLAGMMTETRSPWPVLRPLLGVTRERLRATLVAGGHGWIDDPSNDDEGFERIRMRKALAALAPLGLEAETIALSARRLARAREALDRGAQELTGAALVCHEAGFGELDLAVFDQAPEELRLRALQRLVWQFGNHNMPRLAALERVADWIAGGQGRARTVSGCRIVRRKRGLVLGREPGRVEEAPQALTGRGNRIETLWDRRFRVILRGVKSGDELSLVPFKAVLPAKKREFCAANAEMPAFVRDSLPVVLDHGEVHSIPHLGVSGVKVNPRVSVDVTFMSL